MICALMPTIVLTAERLCTGTHNTSTRCAFVCARVDGQKDPPGSLNKDKCLQALADLRHAKWFQVRSNESLLLVVHLFFASLCRLWTCCVKQW